MKVKVPGGSRLSIIKDGVEGCVPRAVPSGTLAPPRKKLSAWAGRVRLRLYDRLPEAVVLLMIFTCAWINVKSIWFPNTFIGSGKLRHQMPSLTMRVLCLGPQVVPYQGRPLVTGSDRSEERRVGKECRSRW